MRLLRVILLLAILPVLGSPAAAQETAADVDCTVEPRPVEALLELWFDPSGAPRVGLATPADLADEALAATPASSLTPDVAAGVEEVARQWVACTNAGDLNRSHAVFTDAYVTVRGPIVSDPEAARQILAAAPVPLVTTATMAIGPARQVLPQPDGAVTALFSVTGLDEPGVGVTVAMRFEAVDGQWRIAGMRRLLAPPPVAPVGAYEVVATYPHDTGAYTQGLLVVDGVLYEGTGQEGESELRRVDRATGMVLQARALDDEHFGEGVVILGDRIYQLTWQSGVCFVYDRETFDLLDTFTYSGEGWGLTTDGDRLIMSDGSSQLVFRDPETFAELGTVEVQDAGLPVTYLNELEYIDGEVWANVYTTDRIVRIDPGTGAVTGWLDLTGLLPADIPGAEEAEVLNGIAWDADTGRVLVTGKYWPALFEIEVTPPPGL